MGPPLPWSPILVSPPLSQVSTSLIWASLIDLISLLSLLSIRLLPRSQQLTLVSPFHLASLMCLWPWARGGNFLWYSSQSLDPATTSISTWPFFLWYSSRPLD